MVLLTFNFLLLTDDCFSQSWQWAKSGGGVTSDDGRSVCQDDNGNVYMAGWYDSAPYSATNGVFDTITIPYIGASQIFVIKYSSTGSVLWAKSIGGNDSPSSFGEQPFSIYYDNFSNSIYITGIYLATTILGNDTLTGNGSFISKIATNGNFIWSKSWSNASLGYVTTDNVGNIYLRGQTSNSTVIDTFNLTKGYFLAKFNSLGNCLEVNSNFIGCGLGNILIKNNSLFLTGGTLNDTIQIDTLVTHFSTVYNPFVARFDDNLHLKWVKFATSSDMSLPSDICVDSLCNSYIVGQFRSNINFGSVNLTGWSYGDLFIAKFDSNGVFQWAKQGINTTGDVYSPFCRSLNNGDFYIAGPYDGGGLNLGSFQITSPCNAYIARYNSSGICLGLVTIPGGGYCQGLSVDASNNFCIIGYFGGTLNIGGNSVTSHGFGDVYVAKHDMISGIGFKMSNTNNQLIIYANPNAGKCTITIPDEFKTETKLTLQIFNNKGQLLQQTPVEMMQDKISVNITAEAKGIYNAILSNGVKSFSGKIIFE